MFNLNSKPELKAGSASTSSHVMYGRVTPRLQSVRSSFEDGDLLNQEASNAFQPFHYWKPYLIEHYYPTAILNFYRFLLKEKCHTFSGIRAVFITEAKMLTNYLTLLGSGVRFLPVLKYWVSATPAPRRTK